MRKLLLPRPQVNTITFQSFFKKYIFLLFYLRDFNNYQKNNKEGWYINYFLLPLFLTSQKIHILILKICTLKEYIVF